MTSSQSLRAWCEKVDAVLAANERQMKDILGRVARDDERKEGKG